MTNDELKKKIVDTMHPILKGTRVSCNEENACEHCLFPCEVDRIADRLADALIAAGIGDTSDLEVRCEVLQRDVDNLTRTVEEGAEELKEAEHRAEVAERALRMSISFLTCWACQAFLYGPCDTDACGDERCINNFLKQAEKELAEEGER